MPRSATRGGNLEKYDVESMPFSFSAVHHSMALVANSLSAQTPRACGLYAIEPSSTRFSRGSLKKNAFEKIRLQTNFYPSLFHSKSVVKYTQSLRSASSSGVASRGIQCSKEALPMRINIGETSLLFPFFPQFATELENSINKLLGVFKEKEKATRPQRWESLDCKFQEDLEGGKMTFEVFCNPNAYSNAFQAKVMLILKYDQVKITTEGSLSAFKADLDEYIKTHGK